MAENSTQKTREKAKDRLLTKAEISFWEFIDWLRQSFRNRRFWMILGSFLLLYFSMVFYYAVKYRNPHQAEILQNESTKVCSHVCRDIWHVHFYEVDDYLAIIGILALIVGIIAAWEAYIAAKKSEQIEEGLTEAGLLTSEAKSEFRLIFEEHLINQLNKLEKKSGKIYLAISTPSYGYAVLGQNSFNALYSAFEGLDGKNCSIEIILFSPDAHFHYWSNLLMWAIEQDKDKSLSFTTDFAQNTKDMLEIMRIKESKIWLMRETTVRFFAYSFHDEKKNTNSDKAYISLVDRFSLYQNQFQEGFQATSLPVVHTQIMHYIEKDKKSYFERIKICPYSQNIGDKAAIDFEDYSSLPSDKKQEREKILNHILNDYLLGRTFARQIANYNYFELIIKNYLKNIKLNDPKVLGQLSNDEILKKAICLVLDYFDKTISSYNLKQIITDKQLFILYFVYNKLVTLDSNVILSDGVKLNYSGYSSAQHDTVLSDLISDYKEEGTLEEKYKCLIYLLITSGFQQSAYADEIIKSN